MKQLSIITLLSIALAVFGSCDFVKPPYSSIIGDCALDDDCLQKLPEDPFSEPPVRKVLLEEFTGHKCVNCPAATELAHDLARNTFKNRVFLVAVHATFLAKPDPNSSKYNLDLTTDAGDEYKDFFNVFAVPLGFINRQERPIGNRFFIDEEWNDGLIKTLEQPVEAQINITSCYNETTRDLKIVSDIKYLIDAGTQEYYTVWIVEDSLSGWQKDNRARPQDVENYIFNDVFREAANGPWGQALTDGAAVSNGDIFREALCYTLPEAYDAKHCKILVFVHDFSTRTIRQAEEVHVIN
ncbi:MAG: Omp28-related outer membrane protein [Bacteroidia bacterium]